MNAVDPVLFIDRNTAASTRRTEGRVTRPTASRYRFGSESMPFAETPPCEAKLRSKGRSQVQLGNKREHRLVASVTQKEAGA
jgi:hypothetical protein